MTLKIFISWSGDQSKAIASAFKDWIPAVIQAAKPYFSPNDIDKGSRWSTEISKELEAASVGLICLTKENLNSTWIMFEAGALSKSLEKSRLCPMLFGLEPSDLAGPLVQFQATVFSKDEVHKLIRTINQQLDANALDGKVLDSVFEKWWPDLEQKIGSALKNSKPAKDANLRTEREILEEVLVLARSLANRSRQTISPQSDSDDGDDSGGLRGVKVVRTLIDHGEDLLSNSDGLDELRRFVEFADKLMSSLWPLLGDGARSRYGRRLRSLMEAIAQKIQGLEDEIPF